MAKWVIANKKADFDLISSRYNISPVTARLIRNRDIIDDEDIDTYLNGTLDNIHDPRTMTDMVKACSLLLQYIDEKKKIRVIGDYDIDGVCATYILLRGIRECGGDVDAAIPHRIHDGYGLNENLILEAYNDGREVIITCDNGISAMSQIEYANSLGLHVIVTDHHEVPFEVNEDNSRSELLPPAEAIVDPKRMDDAYPFSGICGAVVAWKLVDVLINMTNMSDEDKEALLTETLEEAAIATVGDVMELRDENRIIVKEGLLLLNKTSNIGLNALKTAVGLDKKVIQAYSIGFILGPCLNATGRLDSAKRALDLLLCNEPYEAARIADELKRMNDDRKDMTERGVALAVEDIENSPLINDKVLIVYLPDIHESLAGIIAGRIRERYDRPTIILTDAEEGIKGSGRSVEAYDMYENLCECKHLFTKFGGHKMAAGLSMEADNLDEFRRMINESCTLTEDELTTKLTVDVELSPGYITYGFLDELSLLEPFGNGNTKPVFAQRGLEIKHISIKGKNQNLLIISAADQHGHTYEFKSFNKVDEIMNAIDVAHGLGTSGDLCCTSKTDTGIVSEKVILDAVYYPTINEYMGRRSIEFFLNDFRIK